MREKSFENTYRSAFFGNVTGLQSAYLLNTPAPRKTSKKRVTILKCNV